MLRRAIVSFMLAGLATVAAAENVYKWTDSHGQIHYTDLPPSEYGATLLGVYERDLVLDDVTQPDEPAVGASDSGYTASSYEAAPSAAAAVQEDVARARAEQCKQAQQRYKTYVESRRLYNETADGKRAYLTDAELTDARVKAKQEVDDLCN